MATLDRAGPALATDATTGLTHMVWNEDGQIYSAYYDEVCKHWVDASAIPGSVSGQNLQLQTNVGILGANGQVVPGLIATWTAGQGNQAEVYHAIGQRSPLGGYEWSNPVALTRDPYQDDHAEVVVTPDGQVVLVSQKADANDPAADPDHYAQTLTIDHRDLVYGTDPAPDFVVGSDLPAFLGRDVLEDGTSLPPGLQLHNYNFDFGRKYSNDKLPILGTSMPLLGGKKTKIELDIRFRGGYQEHDPELAGFGDYAKVGLLRGEVKLAVKLFDVFTVAAYVQGMFVFGGEPSSENTPTEFLGGRLTLGLQGKFELPLLGKIEEAPLFGKGGAQLGFVFDLRLQNNSIWLPALSGDGTGDPVSDFAKLVRADGSPSLVGDDPSELRWQINFDQLAPLLLGGLSAEVEGASDQAPALELADALVAALEALPVAGSQLIATDPTSAVTGELSPPEPETEPSADTSLPAPAEDFELPIPEEILGTLTALGVFSENADLKLLTPGAEGESSVLAIPLKYINQWQISPGAGAFGKVVLSSFLEGKVSLILYTDFLKDEEPFRLNGARVRLDIEARLDTFSFRFRAEWNVLGDNAEPVKYAYSDVSYKPQPGSSEAYGPGAILGDDVGADRAYDGPASLAVSPDGRLILAWVQDAPNDSGDLSYIVASESTDNGQTWSTPTILPGSAGLNLDPVAAFDSEGRAVVTWNRGEASLLASQPPGEAYVVFGGAALGTVGTLDLGALDGRDGFALKGGALLSAIGGAVSGAGDLNDDGQADFVVGAPDAAIDTGKAYVVFGGAGVGHDGTVDVGSLDGTNGFVIEGLPYSQLGTSVQQVGDVNRDGYDDLIVGAPGTGTGEANTGAGAAYVVFGGPTGFGTDGVLKVSDLNGTNGFRIDTGIRFDAVGTVVAGGGDLNADGKPDLVIGAPGVNGGAGAYYVIFGDEGLGAGGRIDLNTLDGRNGFTITYSAQSPSGQPTTVPLGEGASVTGDLDNDGQADLVLTSAGQAFVLFGASDLGAGGALDLFQPGTTPVLTIDGRELNGFAPLAVSAAGDVNKDGWQDLIVGVPSATVNGVERTGRSYVVFGSDTLAQTGLIKLQDLDGSNGFAVMGAGDSVAGIGDANQDGYADLLLGNPSATVGDQTLAGKSYILFGSATLGSGGTVDLANLPAGAALVLEGSRAEDAAGSAVSGVGDVNDDGVPDLIVGAPQTVSLEDLRQTIASTRQTYAVQSSGDWSEAAVLPGAAAGVKGSSSLQTLPDGRLLLTWLMPDATNPDQQEIHGAFWTDGAWSTPALITRGNIWNAVPPRIAQVGDDTTVVWTEILPDPINPNNDGFELRFSRFDGSSWSTPAPAAIQPALVPTQVFTSELQLNVPHTAERSSILSVVDTVISEEDGEAIILVRRSGDLSAALTVRYATVDGSATGGSDYAAASGNLEFAPGESEQRLIIAVHEDELAERRSETFQLKLWSEDPGAFVSQGHFRLDRPAELRAEITVMDNEPTQLAAIGSGFILKTDPSAGVGRAVAGAGDVNGDGIADFLIGAPGKADGAGAAYLLYGSAGIGTADAGLNLDALDGRNGAILTGTVAKGQAGVALAAANFDGKGANEIAIGAPQVAVDPNSGPGRVYVVAGDTVAGQAALALSASTAKELVTTADYSLAGAALATGDINDDGVQDLVIGAPGVNKTYVVFGQALSGTGTLNLDALTTEQGFVLTNGTGQAGSSVAVADLDGDGVHDILIGAPKANPVEDQFDSLRGFGGQVYAVFGHRDIGHSGTIDLAALHGGNGLVLQGQAFVNDSDAVENPDFAFADSAGTSVAATGDLDGDGKGDVLIGAPQLALGGVPSLGGAYVLFSGSTWKSVGATFQLADVDGRNGFIANGVPAGSDTAGGAAGTSVSGGGDLNGDGIADLLVGIPTLSTQGDNTNTGQTAVVFGTRDWVHLLDGNRLDLTSVPLDSRVFTFNGTVLTGNAGLSVAHAGNVNDDALPDLIIGAPTAGEAYVSFGRPWMGPGGSMDVAKLRSDNGFVFTPPAGSQIGSVRAGGDLNGDGYVDLLVADAGSGGAASQRFNLVFGSDPQVGAAPLAPLTVRTDGIGFLAGEQSVGHGDFNGDGLADFVVGTTSTSSSRFATIVFGSDDPAQWASTSGVETLAALQQKLGGVSIDNSQFTSKTVTVVAAADLNGDGYDDLVVSSGDSNPFVLFGQNSWQTGVVSTIAVPGALNGTGGFVLRSTANPGALQVNLLGDLNGDGYEDLGVIGTGTHRTTGYVVYGSAAIGSRGRVDLDTLNGADGFRVEQESLGLVRHRVIAAAGDVNGDGFGDFVIGESPNPDSFGGEAFVVFGRATLGSGGTFKLDAVLAGNSKDGFVLSSLEESGALGYSVTGAGDVNGDGYADLLIGMPSAYRLNGGTDTRGDSFIVYGGKDIGAGGRIDLDTLKSAHGFLARGAEPNSYSGFSVAGPGDINGDGFSDLAIGTRGTAGIGDASVPGRVFAAFGGDFTGATTHLGTAGDDVLQATTKATRAAPHIMNGRQGNDILESAGNDPTSPEQVVMFGGEGDDILTLGSLSFRYLDGGSGTDTLLLNPYLLTSNNLDLTNPQIGSRIDGIEIINLGCANRLTLRAHDLLGLSDATRTWTIQGSDSKVVVPKDEAWVKDSTPIVQDGVTYDRYSYQGVAILLQRGNFFQKNPFTAEEPVEFRVTNTNDAGEGSLRQAILDAAAHDGRDTIDLSAIGVGTIKLASVLPTLGIGNDIDFLGSVLGAPTISGQGQHRLFTIDGAHVTFTDINFADGYAKGGDGVNGGGGGLGAGSALTILRGSVDIAYAQFSSNAVHGGNSSGRAGHGGDGEVMWGRGPTPGTHGGAGGGFEGGGGAGGGAGGPTNATNGNNGGFGDSGAFGSGGGAGGGGAGGATKGLESKYNGSSGGYGGFGGFGAGGAGGGGGGGGGAEWFVLAPAKRGAGGTGHAGGSFAGSGEKGGGGGNDNYGAEGGTGGGGAGLGGAIFVHAGAKLTVSDAQFSDNAANSSTGGTAGLGKGGAIFALEGSTVVGSNLLFDGNTAANATTQGFAGYGKHQDSNDVYGTVHAVNPYPDAIEGTASDDVLYGSDRGDYLHGGLAGNDVLTGLLGDDLLVGGSGRNTFVFRAGDGRDVVADFTGLTRNPSAERAAEADILRFEGEGMTLENLLLAQRGYDTVIRFQGVKDTRIVLKHANAGTLTNLDESLGNLRFDGDSEFVDRFDLVPVGSEITEVLRRDAVTFLNEDSNTVAGFDDSADVINGQGGDDVLSGLSGNDLLRGGSGNDLLQGGDGHDRLFGGVGDDGLQGGDGNDRLWGGASDDWLLGGAGLDRLLGGAGSDTFFLQAQAGTDRVLDFADGVDWLGLSPGLAYEDLAVTEGTGAAAAHTLLQEADTGEVLMILVGVSAATITADDFAVF
ncbi:Calx-beta domain-containing protein [Methylolobus aquaticus]